MKKWLLIIPIVLLIGFGIYKIGSKMYWDYRIEHAIINVEIANPYVEVYEEKVYANQFVKEMNGHMKKNPKIDTTKLGKQEVTFEYINEEDLLIPYTFEVEVVDTTSPFIFRGSTKTISEDFKYDVVTDLICIDNYDPNPKCTIEGEYDQHSPGSYNVTFVGEDSSGNKSTHPFTLVVRRKSNSTSSSGGGYSYYNDFQEIRKKYAGESTEFGIDISHHQGDINFQKVKEAGVDFAYIRIGRGNGVGKEYVEDKNFEQNLKGFNEVGIPVGVYFYSNANGVEDAKKEADWLLKKTKNYKVDLEYIFDWENWNDVQEYDLSIYGLREMYKAFAKEIQKNKKEAMLYSSKNYLENIWGMEWTTPVWLAHYTEQTNYSGQYRVWQLCENGKVDGISGGVDLNIRYK